MSTLSAPIRQSKGQLEDAISVAMTKFERDFKGRGPSETRTHLLGDMVLIRMKGVLSAAEQHLLEKEGPVSGTELVKHLREILIEKGRHQIESIISGILGRKVISLYADISTVVDERVIVLTFDREVYFSSQE